MLGAVAEFEWALNRERTVAGLKLAKSQGRVGGNPWLREKDPAAIAQLLAKRRQTRLSDLSQRADEWLPIVRQLRPEKLWPVVLEAVNDALPEGRKFTEERLVRCVKLFVPEGLADPILLEHDRFKCDHALGFFMRAIHVLASRKMREPKTIAL